MTSGGAPIARPETVARPRDAPSLGDRQTGDCRRRRVCGGSRASTTNGRGDSVRGDHAARRKHVLPDDRFHETDAASQPVPLARRDGIRLARVRCIRTRVRDASPVRRRRRIPHTVALHGRISLDGEHEPVRHRVVFDGPWVLDDEHRAPVIAQDPPHLRRHAVTPAIHWRHAHTERPSARPPPEEHWLETGLPKRVLDQLGQVGVTRRDHANGPPRVASGSPRRLRVPAFARQRVSERGCRRGVRRERDAYERAGSNAGRGRAGRAGGHDGIGVRGAAFAAGTGNREDGCAHQPAGVRQAREASPRPAPNDYQCA